MLPRQVLPRQFYLITRRCSQRQFLLRPDAPTNNAFLYCLIAAALRSEIDVLLPCAMSNPYHAVICDRAGRYPEFIEHFHKLLAPSQNALRGRWENFWSCEQTCVVKLVDREAVLDKLVYTATNPVQDHLVDRVSHWPDVNSLQSASRLGRRTGDHRHQIGLGHGGRNMPMSNRPDPATTPDRTKLIGKDADILDELDAPFTGLLGDDLGGSLLEVPMSPNGQHYFTSKTLEPLPPPTTTTTTTTTTSTPALGGNLGTKTPP